ncbi:unnamed protein product [Fusarium graminearum]|uniref:Chromosome 2, complete genome n=1 Tax=Gibberella zeae (strain ATCC MYA-4620 / CBS 123657 / FGSC 9075 / NRRL 31084 / PH-1) TaxID=229533 RepID=I1S931_GIBZE|nr:hypothetical protein FGSG_13361 [Fusarium graminearum PH-1]ESU14884.1 hypothetical protein FGSG_13361 [Fusarium graminearum PH-1]CEF76807.1 unnamed protein product [Fusarium graminearum]CZS80098.1 unnamed protein product [Fusarium graminearum]|eukprot:XP_011320309.1 hypothetical protein FGSG_13361 [Fusarium graminearum PH-1]
MSGDGAPVDKCLTIQHGHQLIRIGLKPSASSLSAVVKISIPTLLQSLLTTRRPTSTDEGWIGSLVTESHRMRADGLILPSMVSKPSNIALVNTTLSRLSSTISFDTSYHVRSIAYKVLPGIAASLT